MDLSQLSISTSSIVCMFITLAIAMILPIAAFIVWRNKTGASMASALLGGLILVAFALILEQCLHMFVIAKFGELMQKTWFYALYGGLAAGLFEETGRLLAMKYLKKKNHLVQKESIMYGIGHGGFESILLIGMAYISNVATAMAIQNGTISSIFVDGNDEINEALYESLLGLCNTAPSTFIYSGIERISAFALQICLSYIVYRAIKDSQIYLYFVAILIHAFVDGGSVLLSKAIDSIAVLEAVLFVFVTVLAYFIIKEYKKERALDNTDMIVE